jgi:V/A-type H+/Na+-transporting ATPase subunit I
MPIVPMRRVTLCGLTRDKDGVLEGLQSLGVMHLIPLREPDPLAPHDPAERRRAETAFRHIVEAPEALRPYRTGVALDAGAVIDRIMANRRHLRALRDRRDELGLLIEGLEPWGEFALPPPEAIGGERLWLYALPIKERGALATLALPWAIVGRTPTAYLTVVIAPEEPPVTLLPVLRTQVGDKPLAALREELEAVEIAHEKAEMERAELGRWRILLGADLAAAQDRDALREVAGQTLDAEAVFAVQGWAPEDATAAVGDFAEARGIALVTEAPGPDDSPPTLLRPGDERLAIGADLTNFYTSPGYRSWDPSLLVFASFAIFFAMIVADAGYAALFAIGTLLFWRRLGGARRAGAPASCSRASPASPSSTACSRAPTSAWRRRRAARSPAST